MKQVRSMKTKIVKIAIGLCLMLGICVSSLSMNKVSAATTGKLNITGSNISVTQAQRKDKIKVTFTFKTTGGYTGFIGGKYFIKYDASQMDLVANSVKQGSAIINYSPSSINGSSDAADLAGAILVTSAESNASQDYTLEMEFTNLFKDGKNRPAQVAIIRDTTDSLSAGDPTEMLGFSEVPAKDIVIKNATLSLPAMSISVSGMDNIAKGASTKYTATVKQGLANAGVAWSVAGQTSSNTKIDTNGKLTVGNDETASQVIITATSKEDGTKKVSKTVKVEDKKYIVKNIVLPITSIHEEEGITENELHAIAKKNEKVKVTITTNAGETVEVEALVESYESDKDVVTADGKIAVGKFNLIYNIVLPYVETDNNGKVLTVDNTKKTNLIGTNTVSIPVEIKAKNTTPTTPEAPIVSENKTNEKGGKKPVTTGDSTTMSIAIAGLGLSGFGAILVAKKKRTSK